ncbi:hypothetical protein G4B88_015489 [Cannabis sativa]|uniref:RNase H type-1 domain-containing protein n=1 Tax=Cannabis sativa TaxID=3483 RepID=A0A7J6GEB1_CANSA|nr:hypothetical protein G4B88_015489 [Cannabis sativa]
MSRAEPSRDELSRSKFAPYLFLSHNPSQCAVSGGTKGIWVMIISAIEGFCQAPFNGGIDWVSSTLSQMYLCCSFSLGITLFVSFFLPSLNLSLSIMTSSSRSSPHHLAINDEEALIHDFDGVSLGCNPSSESFCLVVKRDPFELANSIPFEEMNLPTLRQNHDLQDAVNQFLSPAASSPLPVFPHPSTQHQNFATAQASQAMVTSRESLHNQAIASSLTSSQNVQISASPCSSFQRLLFAVSQVTMNEVPSIIHIDKEQGTPTLLPTVSSAVSQDKGKGIQVPTSFVPQVPFRPLTIGGGTGTKRLSFDNVLEVPRRGLGGGLLLFWNADIDDGWKNNSPIPCNLNPLRHFMHRQESCIRVIKHWSTNKNKFKHRINEIQGSLDRDYDDAQTSYGAPAIHSVPPSSIGASSQIWPKPGCFKLHVDAALNNHLQKIGIGAAVFNSKGEVVAALSSPLNGTLTPLLAEAKALLIALRWCVAVRFPLDCVASDCLILVNRILRSQDPTKFLNLVDLNKLKCRLSGCIRSVLSLYVTNIGRGAPLPPSRLVSLASPNLSVMQLSKPWKKVLFMDSDSESESSTNQ